MSAQASTTAELAIKYALSGRTLLLARTPQHGIVRAWIPDQASTTGILVSVEANGVEIHGTVATDTPLFFPQRAFTFNDVVVPSSFQPIANVLAASRAQVTIAGREISIFHPAQPLRATVGCNSLGLVRRSIDMRPAGTTVASGFQYARLRPNQDVPVSVTAHGPSVGALRAPSEDDQSAIEILLDRDPTMTRIIAPTFEGEVIGWVPTRALNIYQGGHGGPNGGSGGSRGATRLAGETFTCASPLTLSARTRGQTNEVGRVDASTALTRIRRDPSGATVVNLPTAAPWLSTPSEIELLVPPCP